MKTIFRYVYSFVIVFLSLGIFSSCSDMDMVDGALSGMNNSPIGDFGEIQPLTLVTPDNLVLEDQFTWIDLCYGDYESDGLRISCHTTSKELPVPEFTEWSIRVKIPNLKKLKKGQSLDIYSSGICWPLSSDLGDGGAFIPNGASVYVREATDEFIDLYIDHLKYTINHGFHLKNGDYYVYGDLRFLRSDIHDAID